MAYGELLPLQSETNLFFLGEGYTPTARRLKSRDRAGSVSTAVGCVLFDPTGHPRKPRHGLSVSDEAMLAEILAVGKSDEFFSVRKAQLASRPSAGCLKTAGSNPPMR